MASQIILDSIPQTKYLSAENYTRYRAIMRLFFQEHQRMRYQLDQRVILELLHSNAWLADYTAEQLTLDLTQLTGWGNLIPIQDPHKTYTIADFKNKQFQYMMSQTALEVERMTLTLENLYTRVTGLSSSVFRRILKALHQLESLETGSLKEAGEWWQDLQEDFNRLNQNHQDYLREFYGPGMEQHGQPEEFIVYKQNLIRYLEEFIRDLQSNVAQIGTLLSSVAPKQVERLLDIVYRSALEIPRTQSSMTANWKEELRLQNQGVWQSLLHWFTGDASVAGQVLEVTNEVIRRVVQNATLLVQVRNTGGSNKAQLRHLLTLFAGCESLDEAHRLSAQVLGAQYSRHFVVNDARETDRSDSSVYEEAPVRWALQSRSRSYKPRMDRSGFVDRRAEKELQRQAVLEQQRLLKQELNSFIQNGVLDFAAIETPVAPHIRIVMLSWVAMANLSPDKKGRTEYGKVFSLKRKSDDGCVLRCTDGELTMPDYVLVFQEESHV